MPSSRNALTLCIVIRLEALGERRIMGSRFLPVDVGVDVDAIGVFRNRDKKYCLAIVETLEKSVLLVPCRIVRRDVIVCSLEWIRKTAALRPLTVTCGFVAETVEGSSVVAVTDLSSTTSQLLDTKILPM